LKIIFSAVLCTLFSLYISGKPVKDEKIPPPPSAATEDIVKVEKLSLARDDGGGKPGEASTRFVTTDVPIHCLITLNSIKPVTVKMNFVAASANGLKPESVLFTVSFKTNGKQTGVRFNASPGAGNLWAAGKYRADIFIDGRKDASTYFEIQKNTGELSKEAVGDNPKPTKPNDEVSEAENQEPSYNPGRTKGNGKSKASRRNSTNNRKPHPRWEN
jgi:hypothetical protein